MTKTFTENDVIRYFYNEVSENEKAEIKTAMIWDDILSDYHEELIQMEASLNKVKKEPSNKVIENILNYSRTFSMQSA